MENNIEQVPESVFDWLQQHGFAELTEIQRKEVLKYFTEEEYTELYSVVQLMRANSVMEDPGVSRKELLMQQFDKKHSMAKPVFSLWDQRVALWKVAAVFFLCGLVWMQYYLFQQKKPSTTQLMAGYDTVYISKEADTIRIYDTVYRERTVTTTGRSSVKKYNKAPANEALYNDEQVIPSPGLNIISIQEMESVPNKRKGNSIKDDTLIKNHPFITL